MKKPHDNKKPARSLSTAGPATKGPDCVHRCSLVKRTDEGHFVLSPVERFGFEVYRTQSGEIAVKQSDPFTREEQTVILRKDEALALSGVLQIAAGGKGS